jgi:lysophospholipase L1-like esterase
MPSPGPSASTGPSAGTGAGFGYLNLSPRAAGPFLRAAGLVLPGVRQVQAEVPRYAAAWQRANREALATGGRAGAGPLWVALGDSMTLGIGASDWDQGWVGQLRRRLSRDGRPYRVLNLAFSGARVADVLDRQLPELDRLGARPDLVTVLIGSNDTMRRARREALPGAYATLLDRLPPGAVVATLGGAHAVTATISDLIRTAAPGRGLIVADVVRGGPASWRGRLARDHFHPNDLGYAGLAEAFGRAIAGRPELGRPELTGM